MAAPFFRRRKAGVSEFASCAALPPRCCDTAVVSQFVRFWQLRWAPQHFVTGRTPTSSRSEAPWSLSRVVFAWWLTICVGCFAYLWALMGEYRNILSGSAPILLGLQGTTLLVATGFGRAKGARVSQGFSLISFRREVCRRYQGSRCSFGISFSA